jgi:hypothetical protein
MGMYLMSIHLMSIHLMSVSLMGVQLTGMYSTLSGRRVGSKSSWASWPACAISANLLKSQGLVGNGMGVVVSFVGFFVWQGVAIYVYGAW